MSANSCSFRVYLANLWQSLLLSIQICISLYISVYDMRSELLFGVSGEQLETRLHVHYGGCYVRHRQCCNGKKDLVELVLASPKRSRAYRGRVWLPGPSGGKTHSQTPRFCLLALSAWQKLSHDVTPPPPKQMRRHGSCTS